MTQKQLVSVIVPVYNAEKFIADTIDSILSQTYENWELLLIDDLSTDSSCKIINEYIDNNKNRKIKLFKLEKKEYAASARNKGIKEASGQYICFIDSDDLWDKDKLKRQVRFIKEKNCAFSFTGYEFANEDGVPTGKKVYIPEKINYKQALKNTTIWTSTVMFDMQKLTKDDIYMPNVKRGQDTATWWKVLKKIDYAYGLNEILSYYRRSSNSLSSNKFRALKRTWNLYRNVENLNIFYSLYNFFWYCFNAIRRRI